MIELSSTEICEINGGGLTLVEALTYVAGLALAGPAWPAAVITIGIIEYQDYKNGQ